MCLETTVSNENVDTTERRMQCVSTKLFKFLKNRVNIYHEGKMGNPYDQGMAHIINPVRVVSFIFR